MADLRGILQEEIKRRLKKKENDLTTHFSSSLLERWCTQSLMAGVDLTDGFSAAGADDFDPITGNPGSQQVTVAVVTVTGAPLGKDRTKERERKVTGDHVTRADSPYIVTLKASDNAAAVM